jgi:hypothetical protein
MAVPANICVAWPSTVGSIPAGWARETALDSRYILGAASGADTDLITDRGATTHSHTSPSHNPTQNPHTHTFNTTAGPDATVLDGDVGASGASDTHGHHVNATSVATTGTNNGLSITVDAASNDLAFVEVIWIKSDGTPAQLPTGCVAFFESDSLPSGWSRVNGDSYLKGAATGGNGGATGGSNTHTHTSPAHTHTQTSHFHTGTSTSGDAATLGKGVGATSVANSGHTHSVTLQSSLPTNQSVTTTINAASQEPPFKKLNIVQTSGASLPTNIITLWLGTNLGVPATWVRYTAMDSTWLKGANANGESGVVTGGGSQHAHTASDCQPVQDAHTHVTVDTATSGSTTAASNASNGFANSNHSHSAWNTSSDAATNNAAAVTIDLCSVNAALPKHRTVIYVQFTGTTPPPPTRGGSYTSYDYSWDWTTRPIEGGVTPEVGAAIARGDQRYYEGGPK